MASRNSTQHSLGEWRFSSLICFLYSHIIKYDRTILQGIANKTRKRSRSLSNIPQWSSYGSTTTNGSIASGVVVDFGGSKFARSASSCNRFRVLETLPDYVRRAKKRFKVRFGSVLSLPVEDSEIFFSERWGRLPSAINTVCLTIKLKRKWKPETVRSSPWNSDRSIADCSTPWSPVIYLLVRRWRDSWSHKSMAYSFSVSSSTFAMYLWRKETYSSCGKNEPQSRW